MNNSESHVFCDTLNTNYFEPKILNDSILGVKIFKIELEKYVVILDVLFKILSPEEQKRSQRFHQFKDKQTFIICRSVLKYLLSKETGLDVSQIHFVLNDNNKPYLQLDYPLFFNVSHSGNYAIIALSNQEIGVDIERIKSGFDYAEIVPTVFNNLEIKTIDNSENKNYTFYKFWTRKEAIVKATGKGIDDDITQITVVDGLHSVSSQLLSGSKNITVFSFDITPEYLGAIAITEHFNDIQNIQFEPSPKPEDLISIN